MFFFSYFILSFFLSFFLSFVSIISFSFIYKFYGFNNFSSHRSFLPSYRSFLPSFLPSFILSFFSTSHNWKLFTPCNSFKSIFILKETQIESIIHWITRHALAYKWNLFAPSLKRWFVFLESTKHNITLHRIKLFFVLSCLYRYDERLQTTLVRVSPLWMVEKTSNLFENNQISYMIKLLYSFTLNSGYLDWSHTGNNWRKIKKSVKKTYWKIHWSK